jgi:hypothetical protein
MIQAFISQLLPSIGVTVVTAIIGQFVSRAMGSGAGAGSVQVPVGPYVPGVPGVPVQPPAPRPAVNLGKVIIQVGILQLIVNVVGLVVGLVVGAAVGSSGGSEETAITAVILILIPVGTLAEIIAFYVIGVRVVRSVRWRHLTYVALGTIVLTVLVNSLFLQTAPTVLSFAVACAQTFLAMGIGGGLAARLGRKGQGPAMGMPSPGVVQPFGYGAPASMPLYPPAQPGNAAPGALPGSLPYPAMGQAWQPGTAPVYPAPGAYYYPPQAGGISMPSASQMAPAPVSQPLPANRADNPEGAQ